jgi:hypothetical protein
MRWYITTKLRDLSATRDKLSVATEPLAESQEYISWHERYSHRQQSARSDRPDSLNIPGLNFLAPKRAVHSQPHLQNPRNTFPGTIFMLATVSKTWQAWQLEHSQDSISWLQKGKYTLNRTTCRIPGIHFLARKIITIATIGKTWQAWQLEHPRTKFPGSYSLRRSQWYSKRPPRFFQ